VSHFAAAAPSASRRRLFAALAVASAATLGAGTTAGLGTQAQQPTPFRTGTNIVRVDATVIDSSGRAVASLTAADFEVREDGVVQPVTSFKFLANTGEPSDDRSLPIRSQQRAAFVRTDRLLIRVRTYGASAAGAAMTARLIDRRGSTLIALAVGGLSEGWYRLDLPLASIAPGEFAVVLEARSGDASAEAIVPLRVRR
jgi:hypothetical protein